MTTPPSGDKPCWRCNGSGYEPSTTSMACQECYGTGKAPQAPNRETPAHDELDFTRPPDEELVGLINAAISQHRREIGLPGAFGSAMTVLEVAERIRLRIEREKAQARREELKSFNPFFDGDHTKCPDPRTCVGYQNAVSDYENERELRLAELTPDPTNKEEE